MDTLSRSALSLFFLAAAAHSSLQAQGSAIRLNGIDARGSAIGVDNLTTNSTWEAWVRLPQYDPAFPNPGVVLSRWGMWTSAAPLVCAADGRCQGSNGMGNPGGYAPGINLTPGVWHHLATVYGPGAAPGYQFFVDGQLVQTVAPGGNVPSLGWETDLGCWGYIGYAGFLKADVDEARLSNIPRYTANFTPQTYFVPDANTVALWHFDEGVGNIATDATGNGYDFTLHGGYAWVAGSQSPTPYCTAKINSLGCTPVFGWTGASSAAANSGFDLICRQVRNNKPGVLMYSLTGRAALIFQGGTLCVANPIRRTPGVASGGTAFPANDCTGIYVLDMNAFAAGVHGGSPQPALRIPGNVVDCQWWGRDAGASFNTTLSAGVEYTVEP